MSRFRIMHVIDSLGTGGTEEGIRKLLSGLDSSVFEQIVCTVAAPPQEAAPTAEGSTGARVISLERPRGVRQILVGRLKSVFDRERPHVVHSRNWGAIEAVVAARMAGVRAIVHSEHGLEWATYLRQPWRRNVIRRLCFTWSHRVFTVSRALRSYFAQQLWIGENRMDVIPNGVDTERFRPCADVRLAARRKLGVDPQTVVIGTVGRLDPIKDHGTLFLAVESLLAQGIATQLVIVGDGSQRQALETHVRSICSLNSQVVFIGNTSDIVSQLNSFDIFVLPSLAEGMSNALLEAMAVGLPCVATRVGGNQELVDDGSSGLLFRAGDAAALALHLRDLALDRVRRRYFGDKARRRVEELFSLHGMLGNYARMYEGVIGGKRAGSAAAACGPTVQSMQH